MNRKIILILSGIFIFFCSALSYAENNLVLIVDSSHFMKSLSSGTSKTKLAGEALIQFIDSLDESLRVGLIIIGNNRKKGCENNIYEIPLNNVNPDYKEKMKRILTRLKPVGENSITEAVKKSVRLLSRATEKKAIVIISGGRETCSFSPCDEISNQLDRSDISLHTIGIAIDDRDTKSQFGCISRVGNGTFFQARSLPEIQNALIAIVKELDSNLKININVTEGHLYEGEIKALLYRSGEELPYLTDQGHTLFFKVVPDTYKLSLENTGNDILLTEEMQEINVQNESQMEMNINLHMGKIHLDVFRSSGHELTGSVKLHIFRAGSFDELGNAQTSLPIRFYLRPGSYDLLLEIATSEYKDEILRKNIVIQEGKITYDSLVLNLGVLKSAVYQAGNLLMPGNITTKIFTAGNSQTEIFHSLSNPAVFFIPSGMYDLQADVSAPGYTQTHFKKNVTVLPGETRYEFFDLALGKVTTNVKTTITDITVEGVKTNVFASGDHKTAIATSSENPAPFFLSPGKYDFQIEFDADIDSKWETGVQVSPGLLKNIVVKTDLKTLEIQFFLKNYDYISQMVDTYIYKNGNNAKPIATVLKKNVKVFLPEDSYDFRFDLHIKGRVKTYWKKNVTITSENFQSFNVTFPEEEEDI